MRVPPYYRDPGWQRFFAGAAIGALVSWLMFLYMFGEQQDRHFEKIDEQQDVIDQLKKEISIWEEDNEKLNEENKEQLTIQDIHISIINDKINNLDHLSIAQAEDAIRDDLAVLITKDVETVYKGKSLLKKSIENKILEINKKRYQLKVTEILFYTDLSIQVRLVRL
ncbi:sporulation membrane protein YtrI [Peribacillus sp. SCS-155]|uniref:sporulation membrane protein YtrI n=1 Tax=Peribacillus sedimenti TaxID=3115297 RepID=UPI003906CFE0